MSLLKLNSTDYLSPDGTNELSLDSSTQGISASPALGVTMAVVVTAVGDLGVVAPALGLSEAAALTLAKNLVATAALGISVSVTISTTLASRGVVVVLQT